MDDERWLVAPHGDRNWVANARAAGWVELRRGRRRERLGIRELGPTEAVPVLREYYRLGRVIRPLFDVMLGPSAEEWLAEAPRHPVFLLVPSEGTRSSSEATTSSSGTAPSSQDDATPPPEDGAAS
jgi:hypothetical protein